MAIELGDVHDNFGQSITRQEKDEFLPAREIKGTVIAYTSGAAEWGMHLVDNGHLPVLPPLSYRFRLPEVVKQENVIARKSDKKTSSTIGYQDIDVEVDTRTGDVALIGTLADVRYHVDPESWLPISDGHHSFEIPHVKSLSVTELVLKNDLTGDTIENVAHYLLQDETKTVQWAPRTAYRKSAPRTKTKNVQNDEIASEPPSFSELSPEQKRDHLIDALGAVSSMVSDEVGGERYSEITDALSLLAAIQGGEYVVIDAERLQEGARRMTEVTWEYVEAAFNKVKSSSDAVPLPADKWGTRGLPTPVWPSLEFTAEFIPKIKKDNLDQRARRLSDQDTKKLRF